MKHTCEMRKPSVTSMCYSSRTQKPGQHNTTRSAVKPQPPAWRRQQHRCSPCAAQQPWTRAERNVGGIRASSASECHKNNSRWDVSARGRACGFSSLCCRLVQRFSVAAALCVCVQGNHGCGLLKKISWHESVHYRTSQTPPVRFCVRARVEK